jgi:hypothetical protein
MPSVADLHLGFLNTDQPSPWAHPRVIADDDTEVWHVNSSLHIPCARSMGSLIQCVSRDLYDNQQLVEKIVMECEISDSR